MTNQQLSPQMPPKYCHIDGLPLEDKRTPLQSGYDVLSGLPLPTREHVTRECPTPGHDTWVLADGGYWIKS